MLIFVYGSLRKGFINNILLKNQSYLGEFITNKEYHLFGPKSLLFPYLVENQINNIKQTNIYGEVYDIDYDILKRIDDYTNHPDFFLRKQIKVQSVIDNSEIIVDTYFLNSIIMINEIKENKYSRFINIESGDWKFFYLEYNKSDL
jgi:gamma-glutamylaminecyclotransferase